MADERKKSIGNKENPKLYKSIWNRFLAKRKMKNREYIFCN